MKAMQVEVEIPGGRSMIRPPQVALAVLRGRITETSAWFRLELRGTARKLREALALFRERGLRVRPTL